MKIWILVQDYENFIGVFSSEKALYRHLITWSRRACDKPLSFDQVVAGSLCIFEDELDNPQEIMGQDVDRELLLKYCGDKIPMVLPHKSWSMSDIAQARAGCFSVRPKWEYHKDGHCYKHRCCIKGPCDKDECIYLKQSQYL